MDEAASGLDEEALDGAHFGHEGGRQFAVFESEAASYDSAVDKATKRLRAILPEVTIVGVERGRFGSTDIR